MAARPLAALAAAALVLGGAPADATHRVGHARPQGPAAVRFAPDFPRLEDSEWGFVIGGFGGIRRGEPLRHVPVVFVHGNTVDHADWYPVRDAFRAAGWSDQELWALSYNGLGVNSGRTESQPNPERDAEHAEMESDGIPRLTDNDRNVPDLYRFILAVRDYTGSDRFSIVAHSLGVTLARRTLQVHRALRRDLVAFVGIAGANHGTSLCPPGSQPVLMSCDEIAAGTRWLEELNGPDAWDETYPPGRWLTVRDGSGRADVAYLGAYADSPALAGADNRTYPGTSHNDLRLTPAIVADYRRFLEEAERPALKTLRAGQGRGGPAPAPSPAPSPPTVRAAERRRPLPATGIGTPGAPGVALLLAGGLGAAVLMVRRRIPR
jgi:pimeloyl-ACP methyl ester carboxylesterase